MTLGDRLKQRRTELGLTQQQLAKKAGVSQSLIAGIERGSYGESRHVFTLADALGLDPLWLAKGEGWPTESVNPNKYLKFGAAEERNEFQRIPFMESRGSCGGSSWPEGGLPEDDLIKEPAFFERYALAPRDAVAIQADGDSMSNFIVDGDTVVFDTSKTEPITGKIYLIDHPDGLRIKLVRRDIDGSWILVSLNSDKQRFPDERVPPDQADMLKIRGQFVYRQGG